MSRTSLVINASIAQIIIDDKTGRAGVCLRGALPTDDSSMPRVRLFDGRGWRASWPSVAPLLDCLRRNRMVVTDDGTVQHIDAPRAHVTGA